ncbi:AAA family ATPase [Nocardioides sambongensis]|uniref:AAA family ATPase n=1 Tax=Nocardioides sambongensis TaxID=2589074 RepID=UPI001129873D|nr:hypothetical protein [Nocardioides sambongensis]
MIIALLVSTGAAWESSAFGVLNAHPGVVVLKRCVDVDDLLAAASTGQADVAVVGVEVGGLDTTVVDRLAEHGVRVVAVAEDPMTARPAAQRIGIRQVVGQDPLDDLVAAVRTAPGEPAAATVPRVRTTPPPEAAPAGLAPGRVVAVWGPGGAPGRTTVATALAAELARRELTTVLVDADPYGGSVAQQLGVLDEVSGLLAAARLAASGTLAERVATVQRRLSDRLWLVTGLPRADRWVEVRPGTLEQLVERARRQTQVVLDTGFCLEQDPAGEMGSRPERNGLTLEALALADEIVVVGSADPVGLTRLARGLHDLAEAVPGAEPQVVVNRMRPSLGWRERDVAAMLAGFGARRLTFLPEDQAAVDRALVAGRSLVESGDSALVRAVAGLLDSIAAAAGRVPAGR